MAKISIRGVEKQYGAVTVLHDCNLDIAHKEFVVLVGPSGSGKTTLLRLISGLETTRAARCISTIPASTIWMSAIATSPWFSRITSLSAHVRLRQHGVRPEAAAAAGGDRGQGYPHGQTAQPGGPLQRRPKQCRAVNASVALGRAIVRDPAVFPLDEPLSNLMRNAHADAPET